jgi:steroid 5-alpha reductase family enzyme
MLFCCWDIHYINRTFIYPLRTRTRKKKIPLLIVLMAVFFNMVNATLNGYWLGSVAPAPEGNLLLSPLFISGAIVFAGGFFINQASDTYLISLRKQNGNAYQIPRCGLFNYVSCPNFLGEIIEWTGFAMMCGSLPALSFAIWTFVNLVPRALDHHRWYKSHFADYPTNRKAVLPFVL